MEASNVYFTSFKATEHENLLQELHRLMKTAGFETIDFTDKYAAIKILFEWKSCIAHAVKIGLGNTYVFESNVSEEISPNYFTQKKYTSKIFLIYFRTSI